MMKFKCVLAFVIASALLLSSCTGQGATQNSPMPTQSTVIKTQHPAVHPTPSASKITPATLPTPTMTATLTPIPTPFVTPVWMKDYSSILKEYTKFADAIVKNELFNDEGYYNSNIFDAPNEKLAYEWDCMMGETNIWYYREIPRLRSSFGYALKDLNGNGDKELVLLLKDGTVLAVFAMSDGKPNLLDAYWPRYRCAILKTGELYTLGSNGADDNVWKTQKISQDGANLITTAEFGVTDYDYTTSTQLDSPRYYKVVSGKTIYFSEKEFDEYQKAYPNFSTTTEAEILQKSGLKFIPLA